MSAREKKVTYLGRYRNTESFISEFGGKERVSLSLQYRQQVTNQQIWINNETKNRKSQQIEPLTNFDITFINHNFPFTIL